MLQKSVKGPKNQNRAKKLKITINFKNKQKKCHQKSAKLQHYSLFFWTKYHKILLRFYLCIVLHMYFFFCIFLHRLFTLCLQCVYNQHLYYVSTYDLNQFRNKNLIKCHDKCWLKTNVLKLLNQVPACPFYKIRMDYQLLQESQLHFNSECLCTQIFWTDIKELAQPPATYTIRERLLGIPRENLYSMDNTLLKEAISTIWGTRSAKKYWH